METDLIYLWLKTLHITFALSSVALLVWRLAWDWPGCKASGIRRWGPYLVDTPLLLSALGLVHLAMSWPLPLWLLAKLGLSLGYIVCTAFALWMAWGPGKDLLSVLSLALLGGIFYLALNKPWWRSAAKQARQAHAHRHRLVEAEAP